MALHYTNHALSQFSIRAGVHPDEVVDKLTESLSHAEDVTYSQAREMGFSIIKRFKGDHYKVWYNPVIQEPMCAVIRKDGAVVTVLTMNMYSWERKKSKIRFDNDYMVERGDFGGVYEM